MSSIDVPATAYQMCSRGQLSHAELSELEKTADFLNAKEADNFRTALIAGAAGTAGSALAALAAQAFGAGAEDAVNKLTFKHDLAKILAVHPELAEYPENDIHLAYQSIRTLSPTIARDPLMGGTLLGQVLRNRDSQNPSAAPRFGPELAKAIVEPGSKLPGGEMAETLTKAFQSGIAEATKAYTAKPLKKVFRGNKNLRTP